MFKVKRLKNFTNHKEKTAPPYSLISLSHTRSWNLGSWVFQLRKANGRLSSTTCYYSSHFLVLTDNNSYGSYHPGGQALCSELYLYLLYF